jgi:hypothetical protein
MIDVNIFVLGPFMKRPVLLTALTFLLALAAPALNGSERLTMAVSPAKAMAPATVRVRFGVEPASDNRILDVVADSGDFYRSSQVPLDGERAPHTIAVEFRNLPGGTYVVRGMLGDGSGHHHASVFDEVVIIPSAGER